MKHTKAYMLCYYCWLWRLTTLLHFAPYINILYLWFWNFYLSSCLLVLSPSFLPSFLPSFIFIIHFFHSLLSSFLWIYLHRPFILLVVSLAVATPHSLLDFRSKTLTQQWRHASSFLGLPWFYQSTEKRTRKTLVVSISAFIGRCSLLYQPHLARQLLLLKGHPPVLLLLPQLQLMLLAPLPLNRVAQHHQPQVLV